MKLTGLLSAAALSLVSTTAALAQNDHNFYARIGATTIMPSESATIRAGGSAVDGGSISIDNHTTATVEFGYYFTPNFSVGFTGGFPPTVDIYGAGSVDGLGKLGGITYGPTALTAQYTFTNFGRIKPYVGAGPMFMFVFDNKDGALADLKVKNSVGAVLQAGVDYDVTDRWGLFVDVKKAFLRTTATGTLGGAPVMADVKLDPWTIGAGVKFRF